MSFMRDITDDISKVDYAHFIQKVDVPEYVKTASVDTKESIKDLKSDCFADTFNYRFPINTKASCWTSALYLYGNTPSKRSARWDRVEKSIIKFAKMWGIENELEAIKEAFKPEEPVAPKYALEMDFLDTKVQKCPCHTVEYSKLSCDWLYDHRNKFPAHTQIKAANHLLEVLGDYAEIPEKSREYVIKLCEAENGATNTAYKVAQSIKDRLSAVPEDQWGEEGASLLKTASDLAELPEGSLTPHAMDTAKAIETFDIKSGIDKRWGGGFTHPVDLMFSITRNKAAAAIEGTVKLMNGNYINLANIPLSSLEDGLKKAGDDFLDYAKPDGLNLDMSKVKEVIPTIPAPDATRMQSAFPSNSSDVTLD